MNRACLFHANEQESGSKVAASPGDLLFAKALSCTISVAKFNHVQDIAGTSHVRREMCFYGYQWAFWQIDLLPFCLSVRSKK